jgi:hypothetical protein
VTQVRHRITVGGTLELDEQELRALDALAGYGFKSFIKVFYEHMGKAYMQPHEAGLKKLFETIRRDVPPALGRIDMARDFLKREGK